MQARRGLNTYRPMFIRLTVKLSELGDTSTVGLRLKIKSRTRKTQMKHYFQLAVTILEFGLGMS
jgi:hypothetical protein